MKHTLAVDFGSRYIGIALVQQPLTWHQPDPVRRNHCGRGQAPRVPRRDPAPTIVAFVARAGTVIAPPQPSRKRP